MKITTRLGNEMGTFVRPVERLEQPIEAMLELYGGKPAKVRGWAGMRTEDGMLEACIAPVGETMVHIHELEKPENAQRWTALQAYRAKGGNPLGLLMLGAETDEVRRQWAAAGGWQAATGLYMHESPGRTHDGVVTPPFTRFEMEAEGRSLPVVALEMARALEPFKAAYPDHETAHAAVSDALGAPSLEWLQDTWDTAMSEPTPVATGRLVLSQFAELPSN